ncbi:MAG: hypothetical protein ABSC72_01025 [Methylovirgula sp.]
MRPADDMVAQGFHRLMPVTGKHKAWPARLVSLGDLAAGSERAMS